MKNTNILWFLFAFIILVTIYNLVFPKKTSEGYGGRGGGHGGGGHSGGGHHSYGGHGGYYGGGGGYGYYGNGYYGNGYYGRDYGYYPVYDRRGSGDLMTFYLVYPFLILGVVAVFVSYRQ